MVSRSLRERRMCSLLELLGDRHAAPNAKGFFGDDEAGGGLTSLVLASLHQLGDAIDDGSGKPLGHHGIATGAVFHETFEHTVEEIVRGERILIRLPWPKLGARRLVDRGARDSLAVAVHVARKAVDH